MGSLEGNITAQQFWVVAQHVDTPTRPLPQFTGSACDTSCDFSRNLEDVQLRLEQDLPCSTSCTAHLDPIAISCFDEFVSLAVGTLGDQHPTSSTSCRTRWPIRTPCSSWWRTLSGAAARTANDAIVDAFGCLGFKFIPQLVEFINDIAINTCCTRPGWSWGACCWRPTSPPRSSRSSATSRSTPLHRRRLPLPARRPQPHRPCIACWPRRSSACSPACRRRRRWATTNTTTVTTTPTGTIVT